MDSGSSPGALANAYFNSCEMLSGAPVALTNQQENWGKALKVRRKLAASLDMFNCRFLIPTVVQGL